MRRWTALFTVGGALNAAGAALWGWYGDLRGAPLCAAGITLIGVFLWLRPRPPRLVEPVHPAAILRAVPGDLPALRAAEVLAWVAEQEARGRSFLDAHAAVEAWYRATGGGR